MSEPPEEASSSSDSAPLSYCCCNGRGASFTCLSRWPRYCTSTENPLREMAWELGRRAANLAAGAAMRHV